MDFFLIFRQVFNGIVDCMFNIEFMGLTLLQYSVGLSVLGLSIGVFYRLFLSDHK